MINRITAFFNKVLVFLINWFITKPLRIMFLYKHKELYIHASYYPENADKRKSPMRIFFEQIRYVIKYNCYDLFYFPYGCDVKSKSECEKYINYEFFNKKRDSLNFANKVNCTCILRDKILFNIFANGIGISTPKNVLYVANGKLYDFQSKQEVMVNQLAQYSENALFCKLVDGECGKGVFKLEYDNGKFYIDGVEFSADEVYRRLTSGRYLAQEVICQHPLMVSLHPQSVNSMRIVTVKSVKDGVIRVWPSILRMGTGNSVVDNTSQGGVYAGVDFDAGKMKKWGFYKPQFGLKTDHHPDSGIVFNEFVIPFLKEVQEQAIYFHSMLPEMQSVGWDIAIGENGPVFIEGNDNWEINGPQICNGGLKDLFEEQMYK